MLDGDFGTAKILLRDVINATVGFAQLGSRVDVPEKSLMRMFGSTGNPRAENLIAVVAALKDECGLSLTVHAAPLRRRTPRALEHAGP
jgi:DNA-binding phage protein